MWKYLFIPRKRRAPKHIEIGEGECYHVDDVEDYYRVQYFEAIDLAIAGITNRFDQPGYTIYSNLESLLVKAANQNDYSTELEQVVSFYENFDKPFNYKFLAQNMLMLLQKFS